MSDPISDANLAALKAGLKKKCLSFGDGGRVDFKCVAALIARLEAAEEDRDAYKWRSEICYSGADVAAAVEAERKACADRVFSLALGLTQHQHNSIADAIAARSGALATHTSNKAGLFE